MSRTKLWFPLPKFKITITSHMSFPLHMVYSQNSGRLKRIKSNFTERTTEVTKCVSHKIVLVPMPRVQVTVKCHRSKSVLAMTLKLLK